MAMPAQRRPTVDAGSTSRSVQNMICGPCWAAASMSGTANTIAASMIQPAIPERSTERTMPRGTLIAAPIVSSEMWAEASKPVIVYAGSSNPRANNQGIEELGGQTAAPDGRPLKLENVISRFGSQVEAPASSAIVNAAATIKIQ